MLAIIIGGVVFSGIFAFGQKLDWPGIYWAKLLIRQTWDSSNQVN